MRRSAKILILNKEGIIEKLAKLWALRLWVCRRKEPILGRLRLGYVPKND